MTTWASSLKKTLFVAWESVQVELHGQYSIKRLHALRQYMDATSVLQAITVLLLTPLPSLCVLVGMDALPMVSPEAGSSKQTTGFWLRNFYTGWSMVFFLTVQVCQIEPSLPMSTRRLWLISVGTSLFLMGVYYIETITIGFPVPFVLQLQAIPLTILIYLAWWFSWKDALRGDAVAKDNVTRYLKLFNTNNVAFASYIAYNLLYNQLDGWRQVAFTALLPLMKLIGKNVTSVSLHHQEDLAPVIMISTVDVFHTLFVSLTMQQTSMSSTTIGLFLVIDIIQSAVAIYDVRLILTRLHELKDQMKLANRAYVPSSSDGLAVSVATILETSESVRQHPAIAQPRHLRNFDRPRSNLRNWMLSRTRLSSTVVQPVELIDPNLSPGNAEHSQHELRPAQVGLLAKPLSELESAQVEYAQMTLKLLHMTEFYLLLEFVEVMIATVYAMYVFAISYMPNRIYYSSFAALSSSQLRVTAAQIAVFASLELLSLVIFLLALGFHIKGFSPLRQLAFVLRTHWKLVQSMCVVLVHLVAQIAFVHNGCDFTFQFEWLRRGNANGST